MIWFAKGYPVANLIESKDQDFKDELRVSVRVLAAVVLKGKTHRSSESSCVQNIRFVCRSKDDGGGGDGKGLRHKDHPLCQYQLNKICPLNP